MAKSFIHIAIFFCMLFTSIPTRVGMEAQSSSSSTGSALFIFDSIKGELHKSAVPPFLPTFLPLVDKKHPIPVILKSVGKQGYSILLATDLPCGGQNNCLYGTLRGSTSTFEDDESVAVTLSNGIKAQYVDYECHAYCSESYVRWKQGGFFYEIGLKGGEKEDILRVANSVEEYR